MPVTFISFFYFIYFTLYIVRFQNLPLNHFKWYHSVALSKFSVLLQPSPPSISRMLHHTVHINANAHHLSLLSSWVWVTATSAHRHPRTPTLPVGLTTAKPAFHSATRAPKKGPREEPRTSRSSPPSPVPIRGSPTIAEALDWCVPRALSWLLQLWSEENQHELFPGVL